MKDRTATTSKYGFIIIVFLVLALACLSFFRATYNKNSTQLNSTVNDLSHSHSDEEKIDSALGLMYIAENNARMYALYHDKTYFNAYTSQLKSVGLLIDSLSNSNSDSSNLSELVADKQIKTQLFLQAQKMIDSLLISGNVRTVTVPKFRQHKLPPLDTSSFATDTAVAKQAPQTKKKKGLFGRLGDALHNRQDSSMPLVDKMLISRYTKDSVKMRYENETLQMQVSDLKNRTKALDNLKSKERGVLDANHRLFNNLEALLQQLKRNEADAQQLRNQVLSRHALTFAGNLNTNNKYITLFSILLSAIILIILFILYRNELALKKAKIQAENYAKLKSEFTATMSHEIRTPLHSIHAFADELNIQNDKAHQSEVIDAIKLSSGMLLSVVNNILDFTKIEKGKFKLEHLPFNPQKVISEILAGVKIQAKHKNLELIGQVDESTNKQIYGDAFQLRQILLNIISNAIKYTDKGSVTLKANLTQQVQKALLRIEISDTGIGIASKDLPHLFDEFTTNKHQSEVVAGSSGLGLNIVKQLVDIHQGKISVNSQEGKGSQFIIELTYDTTPAAATSNNLPLAKDARQQIDAPKNLKVLLVENDTFNQKFLSQVLTKNNALVEIAKDGETALLLIEKNKYDLILTDIGLPKMSGTELAGKIRASNNGKSSVPIFGLTGFEKSDVAGKDHFNEWLVKPFKSEELLDKIAKYFPAK